jgi:DNA repair photolyase
MAQPRRPVRGATLNTVSDRFNLAAREDDGDWLDARGGIDGELPPLRTTVTVERPKTIINRNQSPDIPFDRSINPYRGCEHGCVYCFARPTHAFHDLSPGLDFETKLFAKPDAAALLRVELAKPSYKCAPMAMGTNTDPYQPIEGHWRVTRGVLEVLAECDHPVVITTKSDRVVRDIDLLGPMAAKGLAGVAISVTSLETRIAVIPAITDHEVEAIVARAAEAGAIGVSFIPVRLPWEVAPLFRAWLDEHFPDRAGKVMAIIQSLRDGKDNDPGYFTRMRGSGPWADLLRTRFLIARKKYGVDRNGEKMRLRTDLFKPPKGPQGELF